MKDALRTAAQHLLEGRLENCHALAQENEGPDGNYLHAVLHRKEGDLGNSLYWYHRAQNHPVAVAMQAKFPGWSPETLIELVRAQPDSLEVRAQEAAELEAIKSHFA